MPAINAILTSADIYTKDKIITKSWHWNESYFNSIDIHVLMCNKSRLSTCMFFKRVGAWVDRSMARYKIIRWGFPAAVMYCYKG